MNDKQEVEKKEGDRSGRGTRFAKLIAYTVTLVVVGVPLLLFGYCVMYFL